MAEIIQQPAVPVSNVAPVVATTPDLTPSQQFDIAVDTRDPRKAMEVATANIGTPVAVAAVKAADLMLKGEQAFQNMIAPIEKAGGVGTPQGNIAVAEKAKEVFKQRNQDYLYLLMQLGMAVSKQSWIQVMEKLKKHTSSYEELTTSISALGFFFLSENSLFLKVIVSLRPLPRPRPKLSLICCSVSCNVTANPCFIKDFCTKRITPPLSPFPWSFHIMPEFPLKK